MRCAVFVVRPLLTLGLIILFSIAIWLGSTRGRLNFSPDSFYYLSAAQVFHHEKLLSTQTPYYYEQDPSYKSLYPLTAWPPGYPVLLSNLVSVTQLSPYQAASLINLFSLVIILGFTFLIGKELMGVSYGLAAAGVLGVQPFFQSVVGMLWSENLFTACLLPGLYSLILWRKSATRTHLHLFVVLAAVGATYVRYLGVSLYLVLFLATLLVTRRNRDLQNLSIKLGLNLFLYPLLVVPLIWRNLALSGHFSGTARQASGDILTNAIGNIADTVKILFHLLPIVSSQTRWHIDLILSSVLVLLLLILRLVPIPRAVKQPLNGVLQADNFKVISGFSIIYTLLLIVLRTFSSFDLIDVRLLLPALVCLQILIISSFRFLFPSTSTPAILLWAGFSVFSWGLNRPATASIYDAPVQSLAGAWVQENIGLAPDSIVISNDPSKLALALNRPCHWLPTSNDLSAFTTSHHAKSFIFIIDDNSQLSYPPTVLTRTENWLNRNGEVLHKGTSYTIWKVPPTSG